MEADPDSETLCSLEYWAIEKVPIVPKCSFLISEYDIRFIAQFCETDILRSFCPYVSMARRGSHNYAKLYSGILLIAIIRLICASSFVPASAS
jgi:hypothetical protein